MEHVSGLITGQFDPGEQKTSATNQEDASCTHRESQRSDQRDGSGPDLRGSNCLCRFFNRTRPSQRHGNVDGYELQPLY